MIKSEEAFGLGLIKAGQEMLNTKQGTSLTLEKMQEMVKAITFNIGKIAKEEEDMTLQDLVNRINMYRRKLDLADIWIHSRPSSSGNGNTIEIRTGVALSGKLLAKSSNGGALNWFLKGMLTAFQNDAAPAINGFNHQLAAISRSNYSRIVEEG